MDDEAASFDAALARVTAAEVAELRLALEELLAAGPPYADWEPPRRTESGALTVPYPVYRPHASRLRSAAAAVLVVFPWPEWTGFDRYTDPAALSTAPVEDALRMITRTLRGERFADGGIEAELDAGRLQAAVARVLESLDAR